MVMICIYNQSGYIGKPPAVYAISESSFGSHHLYQTTLQNAGTVHNQILTRKTLISVATMKNV